MSKWQIVLVDDEKDILEVHEEFLKSTGHKIIAFDDPSKAFEYICENQRQIIIVFSDFKMPGLNGFELRKKILDKGIDLPFAIVTGFYDKKMAVEAMSLKICQFISKPVSENTITEIATKETELRISQLLEEEQMVKEFLEETTPMLEEIEDLILALEDNPHSEQTLNTYFRLLHTIKGTSSCLGLLDISTYAHSYEDLISKVKDGKQNLNPKVANALLAGLDQLKSMYSLAQQGKSIDQPVSELVHIFHQDFNSEKAVELSSQKNQGEEGSAVQSQKKAEDKISVQVEMLSQFLEMSGELTVIRNTIFKNLFKLHQKYFGDRDIELLTDSISEMQKVSSQLQQKIADLKKVSIEHVMRPMRRVLRDSCKATQKEVEMEIVGEQLKVDSSFGKLFSNILVHMIRNSVDHGIENPEDRKRNGKNPTGRLTIEFKEVGDFTHVEISDDGKGIDAEVIKIKAIEKGLYTSEQIAHMSEQKVLSIIFESGFSTAQTVSAISGRGVGMDMVRSSVEEIGGKLFIESKVGFGTKFTMVLPNPRSILIIKSLLVTCNNFHYCIPLDDVSEVVLYEANDTEDLLHSIEGKYILRHHGELIPLLDLREILNLHGNERDAEMNIVIVKSEGFRFGLIVDMIEDIEEVVVKSLAEMVGQKNIYLGTTFIGDGELGMILNVKGIAKKYEMIEHEDDDYELGSISKSFASELEFLSFRLEEKNNYVLPLQDVYRLEEFKGSQIEYAGNQPLVRYRGKAMPLVCLNQFVDEKASSFKLSSESMYIVVVAKRNDKLVGLIVSEVLEILKTNNPVNSETFDNQILLGTVYINDHLMNIIDLASITSKKKESRGQIRDVDFQDPQAA
ncbi:MAG: hypothetical protein Fur0010_23790 [Bdellovibrio sp.]